MLRGALRLSKTATDTPGGSGAVEVYDRDTGEWWDGSGWQAGRSSFGAVLDDAGATSTGWSYVFDPPSVASEPCWVTVRALDAAGNSSPHVFTNCTAVSGDVVAPSVSVSAPVNWSTVIGPVVSIEGTASDNDAVDVVRLEIYDRVTTEWWNGTSWQAPRATIETTLVGGDWTYVFSPDDPYSPRPYWVTVRSFDVSGNVSPYVFTNFTIE